MVDSSPYPAGDKRGAIPPLDLSSFAAKKLDYSKLFQSIQPGGVSGVSTSDLANAILANSKWGGTNGSIPGAPHNESLWNKITDLLSMGIYTTAGAVEKGLDAHQKSGNDSVLSDILHTGSAAVGGFLSGVGGSAFPILGLGGRNQPGDKTEWTSVLAQHGPYAQELQTGVKPSSVTGEGNIPVNEAELKSDAKKTGLLGLTGDILLDPLNFTKLLSGGKVAKEAKDVSEGVLPATEAPALNSGIKLPENIPNPANTNMVPQAVVNSPGEILAAEGLTNTNPAATKPFDGPVAAQPTPKLNIPEIPKIDPEAFNRMLSQSQGESAANKTNDVQKLIESKASRLANPTRRIAFIKPLVIRAAQHPNAPSWVDNVTQHIKTAFPGLELTHTSSYLDAIKNNPRMFEGIQKSNKGIQGVTDALSRTLEADWRAARGASEAVKVARKATKLSVPAQKIVDEILAKRSAGILDESARVPIQLSADEQRIADEIIGGFKSQVETGHYANMPEAVGRSIAAGSTHKWGGPKQVNMWQSILAKIPFAAKHEKALKILRQVEQHFIDDGHTPYSTANANHAVPIRLSDVIAEVGPKEFAQHSDLATTLLRSAFSHNIVRGAAEAASAEPKLAAKIEQAVTKAASKAAVEEADAAKLGAQAGDSAASQASNSGKSDARIATDINLSTKVAEDIAAKAGAGIKGQKLASQIVKNVYVDSNKVQSAATRGAVNSTAALTNDVITAATSNNAALTRAIKDTIGGQSLHRLGELSVPEANAIGWHGSRIAAAYNLFDNAYTKLGNFFGPYLNPAYGNADLRPILLQQLGSARSIATHNSNIWAQAVKKIGTDPDVWDNAMKAAQGLKTLEPGHTAIPAMQLILTQMENLVGSSGLRAGAAAGNTVAGRGQLLMKELNATMNRMGLKQYAFSRKIVADPMGNTRDFSKGTDWLNSWETWKIDNAPRFMINLNNAIQTTMHEAAFWDDIAERFGVKTSKGGVPIANNDRLAGYRFPSDIASQIKQATTNLSQMKVPSAKQLQLFDKVLTKWKTAVTIYMPAHHIRNALGDTYMNWLAGVDNAGVYNDALKVMRAQHGRYKSISDVGALTGQDVVKQAMARANGASQAVTRGDQIIFTMKSGQHVTADMVYTSAFHKGILPAASMLEDIPEEDAQLIKALHFSPFNGKVRSWVNDATEGREHFIRIAHYVDALRKSSGTFESATENAANIVRRWHPDGSDLTDFERRIVRRVLPFYSWSRKAVPLMIESIALHPLKVTAYNKAMYGLQIATNQGNLNGATWENPFPTDQLFPNWLREKGVGPQFGSAGSYTIVNPSNPVLDVVDQLSSPGFSLTGMLNPAIKIPVELAQGAQMSGQQINSDNGGITSYLAKQLPGVSQFGNITNITDSGSQQRLAQQTGQTGPDIPALINMILAGGVTDTSKYQKQGAYDLRDYTKAHGGS